MGEIEIYDISQTLRKGIAVWPGDQRFHYRWTMRVQDGDSCNVSAATMSTHTGTHIDAPFHIGDSGGDIASVSLKNCMGPARVVSTPVKDCLRAKDLEGQDWRGVERVLFKTRASNLPEDRFDRNYVYAAEDAAEFLAKLGILLVGTDGPSIDSFGSKELSSHKILLEHGIAILEGARLENVPPGDYELICLPLKLAGLDGSPVRAVLWRRQPC